VTQRWQGPTQAAGERQQAEFAQGLAAAPEMRPAYEPSAGRAQARQNRWPTQSGAEVVIVALAARPHSLGLQLPWEAAQAPGTSCPASRSGEQVVQKRVGCTNSVSGCRGFVFVDEAAEQVSSSGRHC